ncbi:MAG: hypothetical protein LBE03_00710 [Candidatus Nomurabacteria bacterium]|jgi:hypothetical protein|nr:hypothetical protein [Candidatus Nomurabacteria bacterium]
MLNLRKHYWHVHGRLSFVARVMIITVGLGIMSFALGAIVKRSEASSYTATSGEVSSYLASNTGASLNDIIANFSDKTIIELPAGTYKLSDNLVINQRLILRAAAGVKADEVIIDGTSWWDDNIFMPGYYIDMAYAGAMIEGVTLTHLGTSPIDLDVDHTNDSAYQRTGYSIAVRGGTINRSIIVDNVGNYVDKNNKRQSGIVVALMSGTLSGSLIAHNGVAFKQNNLCQTKEIIQMVGTSHLIGNTIVNNISNTPGGNRNYCYSNDPWTGKRYPYGQYSDYGDYYYWDNYAVDAWDDPILENNVIDRPVVINFQPTVSGLPPATLLYEDNWIHKETENNYFANGDLTGLFINSPGVAGATLPSASLPNYDYAPAPDSPLIDAGTDVFYPSIPNDLTGQLHYLGDAPDLGAYESTGGGAPHHSRNTLMMLSMLHQVVRAVAMVHLGATLSMATGLVGRKRL